MSAIDPLPAAGEDAARGLARVSTARGKWSVGLALGAPVGFAAVASLSMYYLTRVGLTNSAYYEALRVIGVVISVLAVAMLIAATILGVASIARAWRQTGRPGRTAAIALGCIGIGVCVMVGLLCLWILTTP